MSTRKTPEVAVAPLDQSRIALLEASRLQVTGRPAREIGSEIRQRQEQVWAVLKANKVANNTGSPAEDFAARTLPRAAFGGTSATSGSALHDAEGRAP